jgi:hypothetical protein
MVLSKYKVAFFVIFLFITFRCANETRIRNDQWKSVIVSDARGYYAYLPTFFIYHDWSYDFLKKREQPLFGYASCDYIRYVDGRPVNQYPVGTALLQSPFFLMAHGYEQITHGQGDGFSKSYQVSIVLASVFYLLLG